DYYNPKIFYEDENSFKVIGGIRIPTNGNQLKLGIIKYDISGNLISEQIFNHGFTDYKFDELGHLYVMNLSGTVNLESNIVLRKYTLNGDLIWSDEIQQTGYYYEPLSLFISENNTIFITAKRYMMNYDNAIWDITHRLYAYDMDGNQLWERVLTGFTLDDSVVYNNEIYLIGYSSQNKKLMKVDTNNNLTLDVGISIGGISAKSIYLSQDNKLLTVDMFDYQITKLDLNGNVLWSVNYNPNSTYEKPASLTQDENGNIYITGMAQIPDLSNTNILTLKIDNDGNIVWDNLFPEGKLPIGKTDGDIFFKNGYVYIGGESKEDSNFLVLKIDSQTGDLSGTYRFNGVEGSTVTSLYVFDDNKVAITGNAYNDWPTFFWTTQLLSESSFSVENPEYLENVKLYPNPLDENQLLMIEAENLKSYTVYSLTGQLLQQGKFESGSFHTLPLQNLTKGVYLLKLNNDRQTLTKKIVIR